MSLNSGVPGRRGFIKNFWNFLKNNKKLWLLPIVIFVVLVGVLLVVFGDSFLIPFIYGLF